MKCNLEESRDLGELGYRHIITCILCRNNLQFTFDPKSVSTGDFVWQLAKAVFRLLFSHLLRDLLCPVFVKIL